MKKCIITIIALLYSFLSVNLLFAATFSQSDLEGTWHFNILRTGAENMWMRATFTIDSSGIATCVSMSDSGGTTTCPDPFDLTFTMNETTGVITQSGYNAANAGTSHATMALNKKFAAGTSTTGDDPDYSYQLNVMQKVVPGTTYNDVDFQNKNFVIHELLVGASNKWIHSVGSTDAAGTVTLSSWTDPNGTITPGVVGVASIASDGTVSMSGAPFWTSYQGFMSDDKKTIVGTFTDAGSNHHLQIGQITGQTYTAGTLPAETSVAHTLASGAISFWIHNTNTIDSSGVVHFSDWVCSNPAIFPPIGITTGHIDASGTVTLDGNPTFHGQMSDDGTFAVGTSGTLGADPDYFWYMLTVYIKVPVADTILYGSFTGGGIWKWDGSSWTQVTPNDPEAMVASGSVLYGDFGSSGIWQWDGSSWSQVTPNDPQMMAVSGSNLYGAFTGGGIWKWDGSSWSQVTPSNPEAIVASGSNLYGDFGMFGIWQWDGSSWSQATPSNPEGMVASGSNLYGDFGSAGIWQWDGSSWSQVTPSNPETMVVSGTTLYGDFGGAGVWQWDGSTWSQVTPSDPQLMSASGSLLYGDFTGGGIWKWDGSNWSQVTPNDPVSMVSVALSSAKAITAFSLAGVAGPINQTGKTIAVTVPFGTDVTALVATFTITGVSVKVGSTVQISGTTANNFTSSVTYTVTAADASTQDYVVTVTVVLSSAKAITAFTFPTSTGTTIDEVAHTIAVTVPFGTVLTALVPAITHTGASINPNDGAAHDFTNPATYTVTAADATTQDYTVTVTKDSLLVMVSVPAGSFQRDATSTNISTVTTAFRMSQYEITRAQFLAIMGTDPSDTVYSTGTSDPVQQANWYHAIAFCNKLSIAEGFTRVYDVAGFTTDQDWIDLAFSSIPISNDATWDAAIATWANNGYRLPTEMEWEWAAMGATSGSGWTSPTYLTGYGKLFAGSDSILANGSGGTHVVGDYAWTWENSSGYMTSQPVGTKLPNELGLYDMSGNVWEWVWDWYAAYPDGALDNDIFRGAASGTDRVVRGGSWHHYASDAAVATRDDIYPYWQDYYVGFRVVRTVTVEEATVYPRFAYVANYSDNTISMYTVNASTGQLRHNGYVAAGTSPRFVTVDPSGKFAYATNWGDNTISVYTINQTTGALTAGTPVAAGSGPWAVTVDPSGKFAYATNEPTNTISVYTIDQTTGALTAGTPVASGTGPVSVTVDPSGKFAYATNWGDNTISVYTINQTTGVLTAGTAVAAGTGPRSVTVDPSGKFAYAANTGSNNISIYTIDQTTGALTAGTPVAAGMGPWSVTVDPSGKFAYVANIGSSTISVYTIDQTTGALTAGTPVASEKWPTSITVDPSGKFAYATNLGDNTVSVYAVDQTTGALTVAGTVSARHAPCFMAIVSGAKAITYVPKFAYAANESDNTISVYTIDQTTGALTAGTAVAAGSYPDSVTVDPSGKFAYAANWNSSNISVYTIDQTTGALTAGTPVAAGNGPFSVTVDPSGKFAYAANYGDNTISVYTIDQTTGALTAGTAVAAGSYPDSVTVDPSGKFAYATNWNSSNISVYTIDQTTGALTAGTPVAAGTNPYSVTVDPSGKFAYAANYVSNNISVYTIDQTTGALTAGPPVAAGTHPVSVAVDPSGKFTYATNLSDNNISVYTIDQTTGGLTAGTPVAAGNGPFSVTVDPSGKFAYAANYGDNTISVYTIDQTTGALTAGTPVAAGSWPQSVTTTGTIQ